MGFEIILILLGSGAGIAALGAVVYRTIPVKKQVTNVETQKIEIPVLESAKSEIPSEQEPLSEAPPPFAEDSTPTTVSKSLATPTDTTAMSSATPFLAIQVPKSVQRSVTKSRKRKRTTKTRTFPQELRSPTIPTVDPPGDKEPSAA